MADISQQLAQGIDLITPVQNQQKIQLLRQQQQIQQAQVQRQEQEAQIKNLNTSMKSLMEFGEIDAALDVFGEINKLTGVGGNIDIGKLKQSQKEGRLNFQKLTQQLTKSLHGDKTASDESKKATVDTFTSIIQREGGQQADVTPEQVVQEQPQATPQDDISQLRQQKLQVEGMVARTPQQESQKEAAINFIDGQIKDLQGQIPKDTAESSATKTINAIHLSQTGKSFDDGTQATQLAALQEQQRRSVAVSAARAEVKVGIDVREDIAALDNTNLIVDTLDKLSGSIITAKGAGEAIKQRVSLSAGALAKTNETASTYKDQREQFTGVLSRSLGGEKGVLTDRDIARITKGLPQFGDTKKIRDFKMGVIKLLIDTAIESKKRLLNNQPQNPAINRRLNELFNKLESKKSGASRLEKFVR